MLPPDLEPAIRAVRDGGWGDRRSTMRFYLHHPTSDVVVADAQGEIVGTGVATRSGAVGWVGLVFVAPSFRGRGLGGELTRASMDTLHRLGCRTILLAATKLGRPVYDRLGFVVDGAYDVWRTQAGPENPADARIRPLSGEDLPEIEALDRAATDEDRSHAIRALAHGWVIVENQRIRGYALRTPWGLGPAITDGEADGILLLEALLADAAPAEATLVLPSANRRAATHLERRGAVLERQLPRMRLGEPVEWRPERIWAIFNFAMG